jgi:hypothetical protein
MPRSIPSRDQVTDTHPLLSLIPGRLACAALSPWSA